MTMIRMTVRYNDKLVEVEFPCKDQQLHTLLGEDGISLKRGYVIEVHEPSELAVLENDTHDLDEINYLAKRMDSFDGREMDRFCAIVQHEEYDCLQDLINLSFHLERGTLIQDMRSMETVGRTHYLSVNGGMTDSEAQSIDFAKMGRDLLASGKGIYTEHGLLFINEAVPLTEVYDGQVFPLYCHTSDHLLLVGIECDCKSEYVYLPDDDLAISKALCRLGADSPDRCTFTLEDFSVDSKDWMSRFKDMLGSESIFDINALAAAINDADTDLVKLKALVEYAEDESPLTIAKLAQYADEFEYIPNVDDNEGVGKYIIEHDEDYHLQPELEDFFNYDEFGEYISNAYNGGFTENGFVYIPMGYSLDQILEQAPKQQMGGI